MVTLEDIRVRLDSTDESLNQLSKRSGLSRAQLSRFRNGERSLSGDSLMRLLPTLGLVVTEQEAEDGVRGAQTGCHDRPC